MVPFSILAEISCGLVDLLLSSPSISVQIFHLQYIGDQDNILGLGRLAEGQYLTVDGNTVDWEIFALKIIRRSIDCSAT